MRALVYDGAHLRLDTRHPAPQPRSDEALIQVSLAGICNTDLEIIRGYMAYTGVLGHEFVGSVTVCDDKEWVGQRVVGEINCYCGECPYCRRGMETHCPQRTTLGIWGREGAMADYCLLPIRNLYAVPDVISDERAVFVEPLAAALEITEQLHIKPTDRVLVVGDGKLGLLVAQVLSLVGCDLGCIGHHQEKLEILAHRGIKICLAHEVEDERADVVVECTGHPDGLAFARSLLRPRGRLVLKSTYHGAVKVNMTDVVVDEIHLSGSRCGPFAPALRLLEQGLIDTAPLIDATYGLDQGLAAFKRARLPSALKVLVQME